MRQRLLQVIVPMPSTGIRAEDLEQFRRGLHLPVHSAPYGSGHQCSWCGVWLPSSMQSTLQAAVEDDSAASTWFPSRLNPITDASLDNATIDENGALGNQPDISRLVASATPCEDPGIEKGTLGNQPDVSHLVASASPCEDPCIEKGALGNQLDASSSQAPAAPCADPKAEIHEEHRESFSYQTTTSVVQLGVPGPQPPLDNISIP